MPTRRSAEATQRNREPIRAVLAQHLAAGARVLEIASGTGEHAVFLAPALAVARWQPSDPSPAARDSIDAWRAETGDARVLPALDLDLLRPPWPAVEADTIVCVNMVHISPWAATLALLGLARATLPPGGLLYLYGPYRRDEVATAPSNEAFDASLRARDPAWGLRRLEDVTAAAEAEGLERRAVVEMPANNLSVVFVRAGAGR